MYAVMKGDPPSILEKEESGNSLIRSKLYLVNREWRSTYGGAVYTDKFTDKIVE